MPVFPSVQFVMAYFTRDVYIRVVSPFFEMEKLRGEVTNLGVHRNILPRFQDCKVSVPFITLQLPLTPGHLGGEAETGAGLQETGHEGDQLW